MNENEISKIIVDSAIEVHRELGGPGLIEGVYEESMVEELTMRGVRVERQLQVPIFYKGKRLGNPSAVGFESERTGFGGQQGGKPMESRLRGANADLFAPDRPQTWTGHQFWRTVRQEWDPPCGQRAIVQGRERQRVVKGRHFQRKDAKAQRRKARREKSWRLCVLASLR